MVEIIKDIAGHIQEMVRCEIQLATTEAREETKRAWAAGRLLLVAGVVAFLGAIYVLLAAVYALTLVVPQWAAAAIVGVGLMIVAGLFGSMGMEKWKRLNAPLQRTANDIEENIAWLKEQAKS